MFNKCAVHVFWVPFHHLMTCYVNELAAYQKNWQGEKLFSFYKQNIFQLFHCLSYCPNGICLLFPSPVIPTRPLESIKAQTMPQRWHFQRNSDYKSFACLRRNKLLEMYTHIFNRNTKKYLQRQFRYFKTLCCSRVRFVKNG